MKWKFTIFTNVFIMFGFWLAGFIAISPAFNHFVQYAEISNPISLPVITSIVFSTRLSSLLIPIFWLFASIVFMMRLRQRSQMDRIELVQLHTSISIMGGLFLFVLFAVAGVLPFLQIGEFIST